MAGLQKLVERISHLGALFGGFLLLASAVLITVDVLARKLLGTTLGGADLLAGFGLAMGSAWALAFGFLHRTHIRIDSLQIHLPQWLRLATDFASVLLLLGFFGLVFWHATGVLGQSLERGTRSMSALQVPLAIPQAIWVAGLGFFLLAMLITLLNAGLLLSRGERRGMQRLIGTKSTDEEVAEERQGQGA